MAPQFISFIISLAVLHLLLVRPKDEVLLANPIPSHRHSLHDVTIDGTHLRTFIRHCLAAISINGSLPSSRHTPRDSRISPLYSPMLFDRRSSPVTFDLTDAPIRAVRIGRSRRPMPESSAAPVVAAEISLRRTVGRTTAPTRRQLFIEPFRHCRLPGSQKTRL